MATKNKAYYMNLFYKYPDVVTLPVFCEMLGGIADSTARKLLRAGHVKSFNIPKHNGRQYMIPKVFIIEYVLSDHYARFKKKLRAQIKED